MKKKIVIFGAGYYGEKLCNIIKKTDADKYKIMYFCDNHKEKDSYFWGIPVIRPEKLVELGNEIDMIMISSPQNADDMAKQLFEIKIDVPVYFVPEYVYQLKWNNKCLKYIEVDITKPRLPYLELKIVNHCNLNCKGCSTLANISEEKYMDIHSFKRDLIQLKNKFSGIKYLKLFGGEPLLHPELIEFITVARENLPDAEIVIHSNGLLVTEMNSELFKEMKELNISFEFSLYPPTGLKMRKIINILNMYGVKYLFRKPVYEFKKILNPRGDLDEKETYRQCYRCITMIDGVLSCGIENLISTLENKYHTDICNGEEGNSVDIYTSNMDGWQINKFLDSPSAICKFCAFVDRKNEKDEDYFPWKCTGNNIDICDWLI